MIVAFKHLENTERYRLRQIIKLKKKSNNESWRIHPDEYLVLHLSPGNKTSWVLNLIIKYIKWIN